VADARDLLRQAHRGDWGQLPGEVWNEIDAFLAQPEAVGIDVERPEDDEHAALLLAGAMQEAGYKYDVGAAKVILDYLASPQEGWAPERGWGIARLAAAAQPEAGSGIDVERLARALRNGPFAGYTDQRMLDLAQVVAAAYEAAGDGGEA
jgi:hypothetical protein